MDPHPVQREYSPVLSPHLCNAMISTSGTKDMAIRWGDTSVIYVVNQVYRETELKEQMGPHPN
jgi:hypothetical protein